MQGLIVDNFAGGGGASTGIEAAIGRSVDIAIIPFPTDFRNKGKFITWDRNWNRTGFADHPQHSGQVPVNFPEDATPFECFLGGYLRGAV